MGRRLLILQDSPDFGGHEIMFLRFLPGLIASGAFADIVIVFPQTNDRLHEKLAAFAGPHLRLKPWGYQKRRFEPYLAGLRRSYRAAVRQLYSEERPDRVLLLQGRIENLAVPMLALPGDAFIVSYVPMAHGLGDMGRNGRIGDVARRRLYRRPDRFIVPSCAVGAQIVAAGGIAETVVVDNVVTPPPRPSMAEARAAIGLSLDRRIALYLGRLDSFQKGLDILAAALRRASGRIDGWTILFVGSGGGEALVARLADDCAGRTDIRHVGWSDRPYDYLAAADLLLMPSRWEGVPLVMLEAMEYGTPLIASDIDVFRDYLPPANRIDFVIADLAAVFEAHATQEKRTAFAAAAAARLGENALARSTARFVEAVQA